MLPVPDLSHRRKPCLVPFALVQPWQLYSSEMCDTRTTDFYFTECKTTPVTLKCDSEAPSPATMRRQASTHSTTTAGATVPSPLPTDITTLLHYCTTFFWFGGIQHPWKWTQATRDTSKLCGLTNHSLCLRRDYKKHRAGHRWKLMATAEKQTIWSLGQSGCRRQWKLSAMKKAPL